MRVGVIGAGRLGVRIAEELVCSGAVTSLALACRDRSRLDGILESLRIFSYLKGATIRVEELGRESSEEGVADLLLVAAEGALRPEGCPC